MGYEKQQAALIEAGENEEIDRLIEETEEAIRNTRSFLDHLRASEANGRELVDSMKQRLEKQLEILQRKNDAKVNP